MPSNFGRIFLLIFTCLAVSGCGSVEADVDTGSDEFDHDEVVAEITKGLKRETKVTFSVTCPKHIGMKQGGTFECRAVDPDDTAVKVVSTQTDGDGNFQWKVVELFDQGEVEAFMVDQLKQDTKADMDVSCPKDIEVRKGDTFECTAVDDKGHRLHVTATQPDDDGTFDSSYTELFVDEEVTGAIEADLEQQTKDEYAVTCPKDIEMKQGDTFDCTARDPDGHVTKVVATQTTHGHFEWEEVEG